MGNPEDGPSDTSPQREIQFTEEIDSEESIVAVEDGLVEWARERLGDELRVVGIYDEYTFELLYAADAVREEYTEQEFAATGDEFVLSSMREDPYQEDLYHLGGLEYVVHGFEEGQVIRIPLDDSRGVVVSAGHDVDVPLPGFVEELRREHKVRIR